MQNSSAKILLEMSTSCFEYTTFKINQMVFPAEQYDKPENPNPIVLVPGFMVHECSMVELKDYLVDQGYPVITWGQGFNNGLNQNKLDGLIATVKQAASKYQSPVTIIGHSLGGMYSRLAALQLHQQNMISQVITLCSPYNTEPDVNALLYATLVSMSDMIDDADYAQLNSKFNAESPFKYTSIYTKTDGIVNWKSCVIPYESDLTQNIEVSSTHIAMVFNTSVFDEIRKLVNQ